jgi:hypothetical protein
MPCGDMEGWDEARFCQDDSVGRDVIAKQIEQARPIQLNHPGLEDGLDAQAPVLHGVGVVVILKADEP